MPQPAFPQEDAARLRFGIDEGRVILARIGAPLSSQVGMVGPMSTLLMGVFILGEPMNGWIALGTTLVLVGVFMVGLRR